MNADRTRVVAGYLGGWNAWDRAYFPRHVPAHRLTHLIYAFATVDEHGMCALLDPWPDYQRPFSAADSVDGIGDVSGQSMMGDTIGFLLAQGVSPAALVLGVPFYAR